MSFGQPLLLLTLLAVPAAVVVFLALARRRARYAVQFTNLELLAVIPRTAPWRRYVAPAVLLLALAAICVGLARPHVKTLVPSGSATVILVIDDSGSMQATDVKPTRLGAAQDAVLAFLKKAPKNVRVGLVVFAGEPQVATPPTTDHDLVGQAVQSIGDFPGFGGTAIGDALAAAVELAQQSTRAQTQSTTSPGQPISFTIAAPSPPSSDRPSVSILFLSDGSQTRGTLQPLDGAERAKAADIPIFTIALGTPEGVLTRDFGGFERSIPVPPDPDTLRAIATTTGGTFFAARSASAVKAAYAHLGATIGRKPGKREVTQDALAVAAALLASAIAIGIAWSPRLP
jgi:Ca-activated chloride channel family protein